jgi:hypothetical protein
MPGVRYEPSERLAIGVWAGLGVQYEFHDPSNLYTGNPTLTLSQTDALSLVQQSRLRVQYQIVPRWLTMRLQSDQARTDTVSAALSLQANSAGLKVSGSLATATQIEWRLRLNFDAEVARFFGFVPGLTTGFDFVSLSADVLAAAIVPIFGIGIRRTAL